MLQCLNNNFAFQPSGLNRCLIDQNVEISRAPLYKFSIFSYQSLLVMGIDQDILQSKFRNEHQKAGVNLLYTYGWLMERTKEIFASEEITPQQFNILRILRGSFPMPLSTLQIRERMLDKMSDTSRIVDRLITKGLVKKGICKTDRRLVDVIITDKGKKMLERLDKRQDELDNIIGNLSEKEASILSELLDKIRIHK